MLLTKKQLARAFHGIAQAYEKDGWLVYSRFTAEQLEHYTGLSEHFRIRTAQTASIFAALRTDADTISFAYTTDNTARPGAIDVRVNGLLYSVFRLEGRPEGQFVCTLPDGVKDVEVHFPNYNRVMIRDAEVNGTFLPLRRHRTKVLWIGDSISQGATTQANEIMLGSESCPLICARARHWELLNQSVGGQGYEHVPMYKIPAFTPDKIIIALGTNGCRNADFLLHADKFYAGLTALYPATPILRITPLWRGDLPIEILENNAVQTDAIVSRYANIRTLRGVPLVPHTPELFREDLLHPNVIGHRFYADALLREMRKIGF